MANGSLYGKYVSAGRAGGKYAGSWYTQQGLEAEKGAESILSQHKQDKLNETIGFAGEALSMIKGHREEKEAAKEREALYKQAGIEMPESKPSMFSEAGQGAKSIGKAAVTGAGAVAAGTAGVIGAGIAGVAGAVGLGAYGAGKAAVGVGKAAVGVGKAATGVAGKAVGFGAYGVGKAAMGAGKAVGLGAYGVGKAATGVAGAVGTAIGKAGQSLKDIDMPDKIGKYKGLDFMQDEKGLFQGGKFVNPFAGSLKSLADKGTNLAKAVNVQTNVQDEPQGAASVLTSEGIKKESPEFVKQEQSIQETGEDLGYANILGQDYSEPEEGAGTVLATTETDKTGEVGSEYSYSASQNTWLKVMMGQDFEKRENETEDQWKERRKGYYDELQGLGGYY